MVATTSDYVFCSSIEYHSGLTNDEHLSISSNSLLRKLVCILKFRSVSFHAYSIGWINNTIRCGVLNRLNVCAVYQWMVCMARDSFTFFSFCLPFHSKIEFDFAQKLNYHCRFKIYGLLVLHCTRSVQITWHTETNCFD